MKKVSVKTTGKKVGKKRCKPPARSPRVSDIIIEEGISLQSSHQADVINRDSGGHMMLSSRFFQFLIKKRGLLLGGLVAVLILGAPLPADIVFGNNAYALSWDGKAILALVSAIVVFFISGAIPTGATLLIVYVWVGLLNIAIPGTKTASVFSHDAAWFLVGALMMAEILVKYNIHKRILSLILKFVGTKTWVVVCGIVIFASITSSVIADHTVAALLLPLGIALVAGCGGFAKVPNLAKLLMLAIAFGAAIGGFATPSGGGRNVVMLGYLESIANIQVSFGTWALLGLPLMVVLIPIACFMLLKIFKPEVSDLRDAVVSIKEELSMNRMGKNEWLVIGIFAFIVYLWITAGETGLGTIALLGAVLFIFTGLAEWKDYEKINWGVALLYMGALGMGSFMQSTGAAQWLGAQGLTFFDTLIPLDSNTISILFGILATGAMTQVMADGPTVAALGPVVLNVAILNGAQVAVVGIASAMASAFAFAMVIATPPNAIVFGSGFLTAKDYLKAGAPLLFIAILLLVLAALFVWPLILNVVDPGFLVPVDNPIN